MIYGNAAYFSTYIQQRGMEFPLDWDEDDQNAALLVASEWIDNVFGPSFTGYKTGGFEQEREWPRSAAFTNTYPQHNFLTTDIPDRVVKATYEAAYRQLSSPGSLMVDYTPNKYKSVSIDGALSVDYAQFSSSADIQKQFAIIDSLLAPLLTLTGAGSSKLSGGSFRA